MKQNATLRRKRLRLMKLPISQMGRLALLLAVAVVQSLSHVRLFEIPWTAAYQASLSFTISWSLLKLMSIESVILFNLLKLMHIELMIPYNHLVLYLFSCLQSFQVFSSGSSLYVRWPKYWSFSFSFSPSN